MSNHTSWRSRLARRVRRGERGQSLMELAVMLPLVLILVVGVVEVTAGFNSYISVVSSARDGARIASKGAATDDEVKALVVRDLSRLSGAATTGDVTVAHTTLSSRTAVSVTACHDHPTLMKVPLLFPSGEIHMCSTTIMPQLH